MLRFANLYGQLGHENIATIRADDGQSYSQGEALPDWFNEIAALKRATDLWGMVREQKVGKLKAHILWQGGDAVCYRSHPQIRITVRADRVLTTPGGLDWQTGVIARRDGPGPLGEMFERFKPGEMCSR